MTLVDSERTAALFRGPHAIAEFRRQARSALPREADPMGPPAQGSVAQPQVHLSYPTAQPTVAPPAQAPPPPKLEPTVAPPAASVVYPTPQATVAAPSVQPASHTPVATVAAPSVQPTYAPPSPTLAPPADAPAYDPPRPTVAVPAEFKVYESPRPTVAPPSIFVNPPVAQPTVALPVKHQTYPIARSTQAPAAQHIDYPGPRPYTPRSVIRKLVRGGAYSHGFIQATAPLTGVQDFVSSWQQHLTIQTNQVLIMPIDVARYLITNQPARWSQLTVVPQGVSVGNDPVSGLDTIDVPIGNCWGVKKSGQVYLTPDGDMGQDESASLVVSNGQVLVIR